MTKLCDLVPLSLHAVQTYRRPLSVPGWIESAAKRCDVPGRKLKVLIVVYDVPSIRNVLPGGLVCTVTRTEFWLKFAVWDIAPPIVMFRGLIRPLYDPVPLPLQLAKVYPTFGVARISNVSPALTQPLGGETVPPGFVFIVR